jgi:hypothetical protein
MNYVGQGHLTEAAGALISDHFYPVIHNSIEASEKLQAYGVASAIDATFFLLSRQQQLETILTPEDRGLLKSAVPEEIRVAWSSASAPLDVSFFVRNESDEPKFYEYNFLRHTSSWSEYIEVQAYRDWIENAIGSRLNGNFSPGLVRNQPSDIAIESKHPIGTACRTAP